MKYSFAPIDLNKHKDTIGVFLIDSFKVSHIHIDDESAAIDNYCNSIRRKQERNPNFCSLLLDGDKLVGLVDAFVSTKDSTYGFVSFYYIIPSMRGKGLGQLLDKHAVHLLKSLGCNRLGLEVSEANQNAISFYNRNGWKSSGKKSKNDMLLMFKEI